MTIHAAVARTPLGPLSILVADVGICAAGFTARPAELQARLGPRLRGALLRSVDDLGDVSLALAAYFGGEVAAIDRLAVVEGGTPHQRRVWAALRAVRAGAPITYRELAGRIGAPAVAARAIGAACGRNLIAPVVPCHRAVRADGGLGGYFWGLDRKRWLLAHERSHAGTTRPR